MTLILSAVAGEYAIQVSDRRLTRWQGGIFDDESNKAVVFCGRMVFAYTGLGFIGQERTDRWLTQALVNAKTPSLSVAASSLAEQATNALSRSSLSKKRRRLVFVGIGWARLPNEPAFSPIMLTVANALDAAGAWLPEAEPEFRVQHNIGPCGQLAWFLASHGQTLPQRELVALRRHVRRCVEHGTGPEPVARLLVSKVLSLASRYPTIGRSMLVSCVPWRSLLSTQQMVLTDLSPVAQMTSRESASFRYVRDNNDVLQYGPNVACFGSGATDFRLERLNDTGSDAKIEVKFVLPTPT